MSLFIKMAWRNIWRSRRRTLITASSVFFAVILATVSDSMTKGTHQLMISNMVKYSTGYIQLQDKLYDQEPSMDNTLLYSNDIRQLIGGHSDDISYTVPRIQTFMLASVGNTTRPVLIQGIDPASEVRLNALDEDLVKGSFLEGDGGVLISEGLADRLKLDLGDTLVLIGQGFQGASAAGLFPVTGIVHLHLPQLNDRMVYLKLSDAQLLFNAEDRLTSLIITPKNQGTEVELVQRMKAGLDPERFNLFTWREMMPSLLQGLEMDRISGKMMIWLLYLVVGFGILGTVLTMLLERRKEFGILLSLGMKRKQLAIVAFTESLLISFLGVVAGIAGGTPLILYLSHHPFRYTGDVAKMIESYGMEPVMPFLMDFSVFASQALAVLVIGGLIALYPVFKVYRINILQAARS